MASVLRQHGHQVRIVDLNVTRGQPLHCADFDLVGVSCDTARYFQAVEVIQEAKAAGVPVVAGGAHATFCDTELLTQGGADFVIRREGEHSLLDLVEHLHNPQAYGDVLGLSFKHDGQVVRNPDRPFVRDIESLPYPARDLLPLAHYRMNHRGRRMTSIVTSRGCPFDCAFCSSSRISGRRWRCRAATDVVDEIQEVVERYGFGSIAFVDDNFTANPKRVIEICNEMISRKLDVKSWLQARTDSIVNYPEMVEAMAASGVKTVFLGIESASDVVLKDYGKESTVDTAQQAVHILRKHRIRAWGSFIIGGLNETREMVLDTIKFAKKLRPAVVQFSILTPYPGCRLYEEAGDRIFTRDWSLYDGAHSVMRIDHIEPRELEALFFKAYRSFYLRLSQIARMLVDRRKDGVTLKGLVREIGWLRDMRASMLGERYRASTAPKP